MKKLTIYFLLCHVTVSLAQSIPNSKIDDPYVTVNGHGNYDRELHVSKEEILNGMLEINPGNWIKDWDPTVSSYKIKFKDSPTIHVEGNSFSEEINRKIQSLNTGEYFVLYDVKVKWNTPKSLRVCKPFTREVYIID